jgi:hypothetical protein
VENHKVSLKALPYGAIKKTLREQHPNGKLSSEILESTMGNMLSKAIRDAANSRAVMFQSTPLSRRIWKRLPLSQINYIPLNGEVSNRSQFWMKSFGLVNSELLLCATWEMLAILAVQEKTAQKALEAACEVLEDDDACEVPKIVIRAMDVIRLARKTLRDAELKRVTWKK